MINEVIILCVWIYATGAVISKHINSSYMLITAIVALLITAILA